MRKQFKPIQQLAEELRESRKNNDHLISRLKKYERNDSSMSDSESSTGRVVENPLLDELNTAREMREALANENSELRKQLLHMVSSEEPQVSEFVETICRQLERLKSDETRQDTSLTLELTELNENLRNQVEILDAKLAKYEEMETSELQMSRLSSKELDTKYRKLEKRFNEVVGLNEKMNGMLESAHQRGRDLEDQMSNLRKENLGLMEKLRHFESRNRSLLSQNERIISRNAKILDEIIE
jgi:chromosome segregation ATPase